MKKWNLDQLAHLFNTQVNSNSEIEGVCIDSRLLKPGNLFFALKGDHVDGHAFLGDVASKGAVGAVVSKGYKGPAYGLPLISVDDPLHMLQEWTRHVIAQRNVKIVAITGSVGKTTTKEFVRTLLSTQYRVAASPGNSNSQVGIPLTIHNHTTGDEEILVLEMGMTHPGNLLRLVQIAPPEVALITNVELVHACNFNTLEDIAWAKAEIFSSPQTRLGILQREIINFSNIVTATRCHKVSFSMTMPEADYFMQGDCVEAKLERQKIKLGPFPLPGKHNLQNFLAAITIARHYHVTWDHILQAMSSLVLPERRLQFVEQRGIRFLNDSYNANELSVKGALDVLPPAQKGGKKIAVLGSMMELGKFSKDCHTRVGEFALDKVDSVYCLGEECKPIYEIFCRAGKPTGLFLDRPALIAHLKGILRPGDSVLLKGSRSKELWKVLEEI